MEIKEINHLTILVSDRERAKKFYSEVLGLEEVAVGKSVWMKVGTQYLHITESSGKPISGTFYHFALSVENLKDFLKQLKQQGVSVFGIGKDMVEQSVDYENDKEQFFIKDPDGNLIELIDVENKFFYQ